MQNTQDITATKNAKTKARRERGKVKPLAEQVAGEAATEAVIQEAAEPEQAEVEAPAKPKLTPEERIAIRVARAKEKAEKAEAEKAARKEQREAALNAMAKLEEMINGVADALQEQYIGDENIVDAEMKGDGAVITLGNGKVLSITLRFDN